MHQDGTLVPKIDDIFAGLANCKFFCKIDLKGAYLQLEVSERQRSRKKILTIITIKGLYRYSRMALDIKSGPSIFQSIMDQMLSRLDRVFCYQDVKYIGHAVSCNGISPNEFGKNLL